MDLIYFFGRLHVLALHLPLGIVVALLVSEWLARKPKYRHLEAASPFLWGAAAITGVATAVLGYMHFAEGAFVGPSGTLHRAFGTVFAVGLVLVAWLRVSRWASNHAGFFLPAAAAAVVLAAVTGHYGGNLTHGSTYLVEYAPQPIRSLAGLAPARVAARDYASLDPYLDLVGPMLQTHCTDCHNEDKREADLVMTSYEELMKGGETGRVVVAGRPAFSELLSRIKLPPDDESFMPAEGKPPLSPEQVRIIEWWIAASLPYQKPLSEVELKPDAAVEALIRAELGL